MGDRILVLILLSPPVVRWRLLPAVDESFDAAVLALMRGDRRGYRLAMSGVVSAVRERCCG